MDKQIERDHIQGILGIKKAHFFRLLKEYRGNPDSFSNDYARTSPKRLSPDIKESILNLLSPAIHGGVVNSPIRGDSKGIASPLNKRYSKSEKIIINATKQLELY